MAKRNPQQEQAEQREARKKILERASQRHAEYHARQEHESLQAQAKKTAMPIHNEHAAGIDVGDASHWVCVGNHADGTPNIREFPAHTAGLRQLVEWLKLCMRMCYFSH